MALAPSGAESPSAAFLAGQQHGTQLAVKNAVGASNGQKYQTDAQGRTDTTLNPRKPGASPTRKPAATNTSGVPTLNDILAQAKALAASDTSATVNAYKAQQGTYNQQAQDRAAQINLASQAAAKFLTGIGDNTASSYNNAAQVLAGIAGGYSGDLRNTATDAAAAQQAQLANLSAPSSSLKTSTGETSSPTSLANVLYALGGAIPANLLVNSGQAQAAAQRGLPASTLGYGQQQALGTIVAGQQQADALNPQILAAQAGNPAAIRQYLSALLSAKSQDFNQNLALAKYKTGIDQFNTKTGLSVNQFNTRTALSRERLNLDAQKFATQTLQSDRSYQVTLADLGLKQGAAQRAALKDEYKLANGGYDVKTIGKLTGDANAIAQDAFNGFTDAKTNKKYPPLNFGQALTEMRKGVGNGAVPLSIALKALKQEGYDVPAKYDKLMGGLGQQADPFASSKVVGAASSFLGQPYSWGGGTPSGPTRGIAQGAGIVGYDCSSFIQAAFAKVGINLPRTTQAQVKQGKPVALNSLQPGDCIFTRPGKNGPNHVGLYIGNGQVQESPHTGAENRVVSLKDYLSGGFVAARRYGN